MLFTTLGLSGLLGLSGPQQKTEVTYFEHIAPIFFRKCLPCHGVSNEAPFNFSSYQSIKSRIELVRNQFLSKNMPPIWVHSDYANFSQVQPVTDEESVLLQKWIQAGMPKGKHGEMHLTVGRDKPNTVLKYRAKTKVKAEGIPYWRVATIPLPAKGGEFTSFLITPVNPIAVRSATMAIVPNSMKVPTETFGSMDIPSKYLVGVWAPGYKTWRLPAGLARRIPPNSKMVVQIHLRPTGKEESMDFDVNLIKPKVKTVGEPKWITLEKKNFVIDAGESSIYELPLSVDKDLKLISVLPEARFYAGKVQLIYAKAGEEDKIVFESTRWDPYWLGNFAPATPVLLPKGGKLIAKFYYNNDENCRMNEGRKIMPIKEGPTASDEVCRMHLLVEP